MPSKPCEDMVAEYLTGAKGFVVNPAFHIKIASSTPAPSSRVHWICDIVAVDLRQSAVYLCEVSIAKKLTAMTDRLYAWRQNWSAVRASLIAGIGAGEDWPITPWLFVNQGLVDLAHRKMDWVMSQPAPAPEMPRPHVIELETVMPWRYRSREWMDADAGDGP